MYYLPKNITSSSFACHAATSCQYHIQSFIKVFLSLCSTATVLCSIKLALYYLTPRHPFLTSLSHAWAFTLMHKCILCYWKYFSHCLVNSFILLALLHFTMTLGDAQSEQSERQKCRRKERSGVPQPIVPDIASPPTAGPMCFGSPR